MYFTYTPDPEATEAAVSWKEWEVYNRVDVVTSLVIQVLYEINRSEHLRISFVI